MSPKETEAQLIGLLFVGFLVGWAFYLLPTILSFRRRHPDRWLIGVTNVILGATGVGWVVALVWALRFEIPAAEGGPAPGYTGDSRMKGSALTVPASDATHHDGRLNPALTPSAAVAENERLGALRASGHLSEIEFTALKADLLRRFLGERYPGLGNSTEPIRGSTFLA